MLRIEINDIKKYYGEKLILEIKNMKIYDEDRLGIVGINGVGKSTLLKLLTGDIQLNRGCIKRYGSFSYISQLEVLKKSNIDKKLKNQWKLCKNISEYMSGGEKTRYKIAQAFTQDTNMLFADEPTANLDIEGIEKLEKQIKAYKGTLLLVSHDRELLDCVCNKIIEIQYGKIKVYSGNYSAYMKQKKMEEERQQFEYEQYNKQKRKLETSIVNVQNKSKSIRKTPKRMGNSEARLHRKMGNQKAKKTLDNRVKAMETRLNHLQVKKKTLDISQVKFDLKTNGVIHSKILIEGQKINKCFDKKSIFENADFKIKNKTKTALIGENGCGKTTLINMIVNKEQQIKTLSTLKIGYFSQSFETLDENRTLLQNVVKDSDISQTTIRTILARLLFKKEDLSKKVSCLSGGQRVKASFAKLIVSNANMLILDEPTNYLDIYSTLAIEKILKEYEGAILFVSHDRKFIKEIANQITIIKNKKINQFNGDYESYLQSLKDSKIDNKDEKDIKMVLENRLAKIISRLSMPEKSDDVSVLDSEYHKILKEIQRLKQK